MSSKPLHDKIAIVTAGTLGIGYAIAQKLLEDGATVLINSRNKKNVDDAVESLKSYGTVHGLAGNIGQSEIRKRLIQDAVDKFGRIDILISNVAVNPVFGMLTYSITYMQ